MSINLTDEIEVKTKKGKLGAAKQIFLEGDSTSLQKAHEDNQAHFDTLDNRSSQMEESIKSLSVTGGASVADAVTYDNTTSGLEAVNIKAAVDELAYKNRSQDSEIAKKANSEEVTSQMQTEQTRVNGELAKKFNSENITQESGEAEYKVMSQKAVSDKLSDLALKTPYDLGNIVSATKATAVNKDYFIWLRIPIDQGQKFSIKIDGEEGLIERNLINVYGVEEHDILVELAMSVNCIDYTNTFISPKTFRGIRIGRSSSGVLKEGNITLTVSCAPFYTKEETEAQLKNVQSQTEKDFVQRLEKKINKEDIVQELGESDDKILSQKALNKYLDEKVSTKEIGLSKSSTVAAIQGSTYNNYVKLSIKKGDIFTIKISGESGLLDRDLLGIVMANYNGGYDVLETNINYTNFSKTYIAGKDYLNIQISKKSVATANGDITLVVDNYKFVNRELDFDYSQSKGVVKPITFSPILSMSIWDMAAIGDSWTQGSISFPQDDGSILWKGGAKYSWVRCFSKINNSEATNYGRGGAKTEDWIRGYWNGGAFGYTKNDREEKFKVNIKPYYFIFLGINDANNAVAVGSYDDVDADDFTNNNNTFYGNYYGIIQRIKSLNNDAYIFIITVPDFAQKKCEENGYNDAIREIAKRMSSKRVYLLDMQKETVLYSDMIKEKYTLGGHLKVGSYIWFAYLIMELVNNCIKNNIDEFDKVATQKVIGNVSSKTPDTFYVSTTGDDNNEGTASKPLQTVNKALELGASQIFLKPGIYYQSIDLSKAKSNVYISNADSHEKVVFRPKDYILSNTEEQVNNYTKVYKITLPSIFVYKTENIFIFQEGVKSGLISEAERLPQQRGVQYRLDNTVIRKCDSSTLSDALGEIEESADYKWFYNSEDKCVYLSRPQEISEANPITYSNGSTLFTGISHTTVLEISNIETMYLRFNIDNSNKAFVADCAAKYIFGGGAFTWMDATNVRFERCEAAVAYSGTNGDGFNGHANKTGDAFAKTCVATLVDCWAHDNNDDGYSDHERAEMNIYGGLYEYNGNTGVTPSYGSHCVCHNVYSRNNYSGFFYTGNTASDEGGANGQLLCYNCVADGNKGRGGYETGFRVGGNGNSMKLVNCKSINNKIGYACESDSRIELIDCGAYNNSTDKKDDTGSWSCISTTSMQNT